MQLARFRVFGLLSQGSHERMNESMAEFLKKTPKFGGEEMNITFKNAQGEPLNILRVKQIPSEKKSYLIYKLISEQLTESEKMHLRPSKKIQTFFVAFFKAYIYFKFENAPRCGKGYAQKESFETKLNQIIEKISQSNIPSIQISSTDSEQVLEPEQETETSLELTSQIPADENQEFFDELFY